MVVEDENLVARDLVNMVRTLGYEVTDIVQTGEAVLPSISQNPPDLALMDIVLKGNLDGIAVASVLWEEYSIPVVYITSFADDLTFERAKLTEPFGYLIKPFEERELELTIETALYKAKMQLLLKEKEQWLSTILKSIGDGIIVTDSEGRVSFFNPIAQKLIGWSESEAIAQPLEKVFKSKGISPLEAHSKSPELQEMILFSKHGQEIPVELIITPLPEAKGQEGGKVIVFRDVTARKKAEKEIQESWARLHRTLEGTIQAISTTIEMRDPYTAGHQRRVAKLAEAIARELQLSASQVEGIKFAAEIHDIGKIYVPAEILSKPTKLTDLEYTIIKTHPQAGYEILKNIEFPWPIAQIVLQHHERMNGSGYPNGLKGDKILLEARILAVADVVEAMSSHRPYRPSFGLDKALDEINSNQGVLYDPEVVKACLKIISNNKFSFD
ncbi:MAG TPA: HD domain-containing protein [Candidatus Aminicenantes bacterium]|nr:MAG: histidine kinase [Candidatus Aminicenantes bacterium]HEK85233.1 HD domain-containing protein [Candidatus Aminicenantes bacterium]